MFPNPNYKWTYSSFSLYKIDFSFKQLGVAGRLQLPGYCYYDNYEFWYGDPLNWQLNHSLYIKNNSVIVETCKYIYLEINSVFEIIEEQSKEIIDSIIALKNPQKPKKYAGQREISVEEKSIYCASGYQKYDEEKLKDQIEFVKKKIYRGYDPRIGEACNTIYNKRLEGKLSKKPIYLCDEELKEELISKKK